MDILLISALAEKKNGGVGIWTKTFLDYCRKEKITADFVNMNVYGTRLENLTAKRSIRDEVIRTRRIFTQLKRFLSNGKYELAHVNTSCGTYGLLRDFIIIKKIKKRNIPIVVQYHCNVRDCVKNFFLKKILRRIASMADLNLVLNEDSKHFISETTNVFPELLPNFIEVENVINSKKIKRHIKNIIYAGRVEVKKGSKEIYELAKRFPEYNFTLAGSISEDARKWDKPENVTLVGPVEKEQLFDMLDKSDLFLFPSHTEGFSLSLLESMARGIPSIVTNVGANRDMIENKGGYIIDVKAVDDMDTALRKLSDYNLRKEMSAWLINKVKTEYITTVVLNKLLQLYTKVCYSSKSKESKE